MIRALWPLYMVLRIVMLIVRLGALSGGLLFLALVAAVVVVLVSQ